MDTTLIITIAVTAIVSFIGFQNPQVFEKYKFNVAAIQNRKEYYRILTAGFLHADMMHLFFNMLTLYFFGPIVIEAFGSTGFLIIYLGSIILGNFFSLYLYKSQPWYSAIGASGGVSGVLFASVAMYPFMQIGIFPLPFGIWGFVFGLLYFSYSVYMMLNPKQYDNIGHSAHLGGAFFGLIYAVAMFPSVAASNALYLGIMSLPLIYMTYMVFIKKRIG